MMKIQLKQNRCGSILLEAILTVVILSIGLTLIIQSMASALRALALTEDYSSAMMLLDRQLFPYIANGTDKATVQEKGQLEHFNTAYDYAVRAAAVGDPQSSLKELNADISWGAQGHRRKLTVTTFLFEKPDDKT